ncbi:tyrosine-type recombinase/integrase [Nitrospira sp. M1]
MSAFKGFRLAFKSDPPKVAKVPRWKNLKEPPPRSGFREFEEFIRVREVLPPLAKVVVTICYWTGMRSGEVLTLTWRQIKFDSRMKTVTMELSGADTKTGEPRMVIMGGDLYNAISSWYKDTNCSIPSVSGSRTSRAVSSRAFA